MSNIKVNDYVVAIKEIEDILQRSVGLVEKVAQNDVTVFFIGKGKHKTTNLESIEYIDIKKVGEKKEIKKKICNVCHLLKEIDEFEVNQTDAQGRKTTRPTCRECRKAIDGMPMPHEDARKLEAMAPRDIFICPICQKTSIVGITANLVKDHDHITGKAREWICDSCNTGLGRFKDSVELLQRAIDYLKKYS